MIKKTKRENNSNLNYIIIDNKSKLKVLREENEGQILMNFVNSITVDKEDNIGQELNKFFIKILPENKEGDILKVNYALSEKVRISSSLNKKQFNKIHEEYMTQIMNTKVSQNFILSREINEKLSVILAVIYQKINKKNKFKKIEDLFKYIEEKSENNASILEKYKDKNDLNASAYIILDKSVSNIYKDDHDNFNKGSKNLFSNDNSLSTSSSRISRVINYNNNEFTQSVYLDYNVNNTYKFKELKQKSGLIIPLEIFILREKFEKIKKLKLILKRNTSNNELLLLEPKDIINNIFILFNIKWLFPFLIEIELDLTNESILKDEIKSFNEKYKNFLKQTKKNKKSTNYQSEYIKRVYDIHKKSIFNEQNKNNINEENDFLSASFSILSSVKDNKDEEIKKQEHFLNKYMSSLEMIIIYWYFLSKLDYIKTCNFTIPINLEEKLKIMLKEKKVALFDDFNLLNKLSSDKIIEVTLDFNSLDDKLFQQVLDFLFKNNKMKNCRLSFFPPEEYFEPQFLLNLLLNSDYQKNSNYINAIGTNEEVDIFSLRQLSEPFQININKLFSLFKNRPSIQELSLIFDMPNLFNKTEYYEIIIIKLIMNIFTYIEKSVGVSNFVLKSLTIIADNLFLDNKKHPFLNIFFENITYFEKKNLKLEKLTLKTKMSGLTNIYRIIPYHVNYLSMGSFDLPTFEYFVEYITSIEFNMHSEIRSLQITLGNTIFSIKECFDLLLKLLTEYPKNLEEISIYSSMNANYYYIKSLLEKTNYNKIEKIFLQFNKNSLEDEKLKQKYGRNLDRIKNNKDNNFLDLYFVKNNEKNKDKILRILYKVGNKYNNKFMDYNIFIQIEKYLNDKDKKINIIQYK